MGEKANKQLLEKKAVEYAEMMEIDDNEIKTIVERCYVWAGLGKKNVEIVKDLRLTKKQFDELQIRYPAIIGALKNGKDYANLLLNFSAQEMAMGHYYLEREVVQMETIVDYDENGRKVGERKVPIKVMIKEEQKPDATMLKFLLSAKQPDVYGKMIIESNEVQIKREFDGMDTETKIGMAQRLKMRVTKTGVEKK